MKDLWYTWGKENIGIDLHKVFGGKVTRNTTLKNNT
jgi:hypothetical protein